MEPSIHKRKHHIPSNTACPLMVKRHEAEFTDIKFTILTNAKCVSQ